jgi:hypothetical protein
MSGRNRFFALTGIAQDLFNIRWKIRGSQTDKF